MPIGQEVSWMLSPSVSQHSWQASGAKKLKTEVLERHASIHAFCKAHPELSRATVYLVLSGKYPGNLNMQTAKIRAALSGDNGNPDGIAGKMPNVLREDIAPVLQEIRCGHCRRLDRRGCPDCRRQTEKEALELYSRLYPGL